MTLAAADLDPKQFWKISDMVFRTAKINLREGQEALVRARLMKRLRSLGMDRVEDYIDYINFDKSTQQELINRFWDYLEPGRYLFVGHSEGLSSVRYCFRCVRPAVYKK